MAPHNRRTYWLAALALAASVASAQVTTQILTMMPPTNSSGAPTGIGIIKWIGGTSQVPTIDVTGAWSSTLLISGNSLRVGNGSVGDIISLATGGGNIAFQNVGGTFEVFGNGATLVVGLTDTGSATNSINTNGGIQAAKQIKTSGTMIDSIQTSGGVDWITNSFRTSLSGSASAAATVDYTLPVNAPAVTGYVLSSTTGGVMSWVANGAGGCPAGAAGQLQYYNSGSCGASADLVWSTANNGLTITLTGGQTTAPLDFTDGTNEITFGGLTVNSNDVANVSKALTVWNGLASANKPIITMADYDNGGGSHIGHIQVCDGTLSGGYQTAGCNLWFSGTGRMASMASSNVIAVPNLTVVGGKTLSGYMQLIFGPGSTAYYVAVYQ